MLLRVIYTYSHTHNTHGTPPVSTHTTHKYTHTENTPSQCTHHTQIYTHNTHTQRQRERERERENTFQLSQLALPCPSNRDPKQQAQDKGCVLGALKSGPKMEIR